MIGGSRIRRALFVGVALALVAGCGMDRDGTPLGEAPLTKHRGLDPAGVRGSAGKTAAGTPLSELPAGAAPDKQKPTLKEIASKRPMCPHERKVVDAKPGTPAAVIAELYAAALDPDETAGLATFQSHFLPRHDRKWIARQYWPRIRKHVDKYITEMEPLTYTICREEQKGQAIKIFVRSYDSKKSDPPISFVQHDGAWKVDFFTP